jgi:putative membrane protein
MRVAQFVMAVGIAASVAACGAGTDRPGDTTGAREGMGTGTAGTAGTAGELARGDRDFVQDMLQENQAEVQLGQLAQGQATNPQVRQFAETLVNDHRQAADELRQIAQRHNVQAEGPDDDHRDLHEKLSRLKGREFDREFMREMVRKHEQAIGDVEDKMENADNPDLRQWAQKTLPVLRQHHQQAQEIEKSLGGGTRR